MTADANAFVTVPIRTDEPPIVPTKLGKVRGRWRGPKTIPSAAFLGIPYAQDPVGELRFGAPVPPSPWDGVRDATEYGATALRVIIDPYPMVPEPIVPGEDILHVNVFSPNPGDTQAQLPVVVWIHGGAFVGGSPACPWFDGKAFNRDGVVTVTISYRLGFDGFGFIPDAPSNRGVRDWLAALEWVRENISAFGGDPDNVTIAGQSAGASAVLALIGMPAAQGLFRAGWAASPFLGCATAERAQRRSLQLASLAAVPARRDGFARIDDQTLARWQDLVATPASRDPREILHTLNTQGLPWAPMIDGDLITQQTVDALRSGVGKDISLVVGTTDDEYTMVIDRATRKLLRFIPPALALAPWPVTRDQRREFLKDNGDIRHRGSSAILGRFVTDMLFRSRVIRIAEARADAPTWVYRFAWPSPVDGWAHHNLDVPFFFDCLQQKKVAKITGPHPPQALATTVHGSAVTFARDGDPGWSRWSAAHGTTRVFGDEPGRPGVVSHGYASARALA